MVLNGNYRGVGMLIMKTLPFEEVLSLELQLNNSEFSQCRT